MSGAADLLSALTVLSQMRDWFHDQVARNRQLDPVAENPSNQDLPSEEWVESLCLMHSDLNQFMKAFDFVCGQLIPTPDREGAS